MPPAARIPDLSKVPRDKEEGGVEPGCAWQRYREAHDGWAWLETADTDVSAAKASERGSDPPARSAKLANGCRINGNGEIGSLQRSRFALATLTECWLERTRTGPVPFSGPGPIFWSRLPPASRCSPAQARSAVGMKCPAPIGNACLTTSCARIEFSSPLLVSELSAIHRQQRPRQKLLLGRGIVLPSQASRIGAFSLGFRYRWNMFTSLSRGYRTAAVAGFLFLAAYVALASSAAANKIAYSIIDYPANEGVVSGMGTDRISGTIVTDGAIGPISATNILGGTLAFTDPKGDGVAGPATIDSPIDLQATPTELLLSSGSSFSIHATQTEPHTTDGVDAATVTYQNFASNSQYYGEIGTIIPAHSVLSSFDSAPVSTDPGSIGSTPIGSLPPSPNPRRRSWPLP